MARGAAPERNRRGARPTIKQKTSMVKSNVGNGGKGKGGKGGQWFFVPNTGPSGKKTNFPALAPWAKGNGGKGPKGGGKGMYGKAAQNVMQQMKQMQQRGGGRRGGGEGGGGGRRGGGGGQGDGGGGEGGGGRRGGGGGEGGGAGGGKRGAKGQTDRGRARRTPGEGGRRGGKGSDKAKAPNKQLDKLQALDASLKVWVGGLGENAKWKEVQEHFKEIGDAKVAMMTGGKACLAFDTADEATSAIATLNGSDLDGKSLEVDTWTQKERVPREKRDRKAKVVKDGFAAKVSKSKRGRIDGNKETGKKVVSRFWEKLKVMDVACKVKVSNLAEETTGKQLKDHCAEVGAECQIVDLMVTQKGVACVGFETADIAESAIASVGGSELAGQTLEVAPWTAFTNRRDKKKKADA